VRAVAEQRASDIAAKGSAALILEIFSTATGWMMRIADPLSHFPQSLAYKLSTPSDRAAALDYLRRTDPSRVEFIGAAKVPYTVLDAILELGCPIDVLVADGSLLCPHGGFVRPDGSICGAPRIGRLCDDCLFRLPAGEVVETEDPKERYSSLEKLITRARRIYAPNKYAKSFTARFIGRRKISDLKSPKRNSAEPHPSTPSISGDSIGFVAIGHGMAEYRFMKRAAVAINRELPERTIVVIGDTIDDIGLMKLDNVHVIGNVEPNEYSRIMLQHAIGALVIPARQPLFGHPTIDGLTGRLPTAFFDWSFGEISARSEDLALSPDLPDEQIVTTLLAWLSRN
jgi:hypothetical protein